MKKLKEMIMRKQLLTCGFLAPLLLFGLATASFSQSAKLDLSRIDKLASKASKTADVNLEGPMLQLAAQNMASKKHPGRDDLQTQQMLEHLKGIYVRAYNFNKPGEYSRSDLAGILRQLHSEGWTNIVEVKNKEQNGGQKNVNISVMKEGGEVIGMAIVAAQPDKLVVVNIVGPIDFSQLSNLGELGGMMGGVMGGVAGLQHRGPAAPPHAAPGPPAAAPTPAPPAPPAPAPGNAQ